MKNTEALILERFIVVASGCHEWTGTRDKDGYPLVKWNGKTHRASRLIWSFRYGSIPDGLEVLHHCDNPPCIRNEHHFLGTKVDNRADCVAKGRQAQGASNGRSTHPELTARGERHGSRTMPDRVPRGERHGHFGKPAMAHRGANGRFVTNGEIVNA